jgi:hypothetical protein
MGINQLGGRWECERAYLSHYVCYISMFSTFEKCSKPGMSSLYTGLADRDSPFIACYIPYISSLCCLV